MACRLRAWTPLLTAAVPPDKIIAIEEVWTVGARTDPSERPPGALMRCKQDPDIVLRNLRGK